ncbi:DEAD/DEAH box helicase [Nocardioides limicola]|uniref:DEAD/DEAH box helicase n=1 Tax=Nocardioides limicola TaxID=2803368 RepID=UPI00193C2666|nr:DEAD/DEAH box helicase [Nocardioides sp. DJM-14]
MNILNSLSDEALRRFFDAASLARGQDYAARGRVLQPEISELGAENLSVTARVKGTEPLPYHVQLYAEMPSGELWLTTMCSCPVRIACKHGAALAVTLGQSFAPQPAPPREDWKERLEHLIGELAEQSHPDDDLPPLALEFKLGQRRPYYGSDEQYRVHLRPLRRGARGQWVKGGADWRDLPHLPRSHGHPRAQVAALLALHRAMNSQFQYYSAEPHLEEFGGRVVDLLRDVRDSGVELLPRRPLTELRIVDEPLHLATDLTRTEDGTTVRLGLVHEDRLWSGDDVLAIGDHSVGLLSDGALRIARLDRPVSAATMRFLLSTPTVDVPADAHDRLDEVLAPMTRLVELRSPDGSVPLPEPITPTLLLTVTWHSSTKASLRWEWRYAGRLTRLTSTDTLGGLRDPNAERRISDQVPIDLLHRSTATDGDALALAIHDLPTLREMPGIEVVEDERPDFRESTDDPEIAFAVAEESSGTDWLDLAVIITVEGEPIPLPDVLAALTLDLEYLVLPSGLYLRTDRPEFAQLRDVVKAAEELKESEGDGVSVGRHDLGVWAQLAELGIVDSQAAEWVRRAQALRDLTDIDRPDPVGITAELRSYQLEGFWWLSFLIQHGLGGILADDMGLGKTLQVLAAIAHATHHGEQRPFLVIAPTSVVTAWAHESALHAPGLRVAVATRKSDDVAALAADADVVVTTYALARLAEERYTCLEWAGLILDEAQQVKNHQSKTYAAIRKIEAPFRLAVTGTPFENRLMELWALLSLTVPGLYPWPAKFKEHVARPVEKTGDEAALRRFRQRIRPFLLRRTKELVADELPPKQEQILDVTLSPRHRKIYDTHLAKERQKILGLVEDFDRNRVAIFAALTKLRQLALDPALVDAEHHRVGSAKLDVLVDHLAEITAEGHQALVFSQFTSFLGRVRERLTAEGVATTYLDGATRDRGAVIDQFRRGEASAFLISLKAGGVGLTLTEADYVFVLDPWWNPAAEAQAVDRAHRIGQTKHVHVYRLLSTDTIEEKVMELKDRKAELFAQVMDGDQAMSTGIDADDIRGLFSD